MTPPTCTRRAFLLGGLVAPLLVCHRPGRLVFAVDPEPAVPAWVGQVGRMTFTGDVAQAAAAGAQVVHTNLIWPYFPLRRDGGGLSPEDDRKFKDLVAAAKKHGVRVCLGLPPFPPVALVEKHPDWRIHPDRTGAVLKLKPTDDLGTRLGCNLGPWGDYLIDLCAELVRDYGIDGFSFDGNYHPAICYCPACVAAYRKDRAADLPPRVDLDAVPYREYLVWRGERLEDHYRRLQRAIKAANADAVIGTWTVNAGRYGHFLHSPRAMPTRLNRVFDFGMQEWWLDETNLGGSVAPAFGAAYLRAAMAGRVAAAEPYLMSRGGPYGTDSFPPHERLTRTLLALSHGCVAAESLGWPGHAESAKASLAEVARRERWVLGATPLPWAALLVSEQTRQFYAYKDIAQRFLPHVLGAFRAATEEHLPLTLLNDWDVTPEGLARYAVVVLPNAAALSDAQVKALRDYVHAGGGLVATGETSLCDDLGRPRGDFALADVFGLRYQGRPKTPLARPAVDPNFAVALDDDYWKQRVGVARLTWTDHALVADDRLRLLVPTRSVNGRAPLVRVGDLAKDAAVAVSMHPEGHDGPPLSAIVTRPFGKGRVVYFAAALDAALWSYAYPYQRRLLARAIETAASRPVPVRVVGPMCVQATYFTQAGRTVVHVFNGVNTTANHGLPASEVPLREEVVPIHGVKVRFADDAPKRFVCQPGDRPVTVTRDGAATVVELPPLDVHAMLVGEG